MVVTDAVSGNPDPESRRDRALTRRIESLRAALSAAESEKAALRRERDVAQRRAEAAGRLLDEVRAEASARMSELETKAAAAELSRMSAERSALIEGEKFRYADYRARQLASMLEALQRRDPPDQPPAKVDDGGTQYIDFDMLRTAVQQPAISSIPPAFPVTRPGYSRPQVNRFVSWASNGRFKLRPTARFELKDGGYAVANVHAYVESVAEGLDPAVREAVLTELTLARQR
jgi:hypothetical protein